MRTLVVSLLCLLSFAPNAEARSHHHYKHYTIQHTVQNTYQGPCINSNDVMHPCTYDPNSNFLLGVRSINVRMKRIESRLERRGRRLVVVEPTYRQTEERPFYNPAHVVERVAKRVVYTASQIVGGRPAGCPYQFCACGASLEIFGRIIPRLNLAANWFSFPRTTPAPNTVAVSSHHVFVLKEHVRGDVWLVKDYNSGGHMTRLHERSISRYTIVDPHV